MSSVQTLIDQLLDKLTGWAETLLLMIPNLLVAIVVVLIAMLLARWIQRAVVGLTRRVSGNRPISELMGTVARIATLVAGLFLALGLLQLDKTVTSLLAGVGLVGLALGFAFQDIAANFMSGLIMAFRRPFREGDLVEIAGRRGRIVQLSMRATEIETLDGLSILVPNKEIFQNSIVNYTRTATRRMDLELGTAYSDDLEHVRQVTVDAVQDVPHRDRTRDVELFFTGFGDSAIGSTVRVWLDRSDEIAYLEARSEAMIAIKGAYDEAGITIPFPIRVLDFGASAVGGEPLGAMPLRIAAHEAGTAESESGE